MKKKGYIWGRKGTLGNETGTHGNEKGIHLKVKDTCRYEKVHMRTKKGEIRYISKRNILEWNEIIMCGPNLPAYIPYPHGIFHFL